MKKQIKIPLNLMSYQEAIDLAKKEPGVNFIGISYDSPYKILEAFAISFFEEEDENDPDSITIDYASGETFSSEGEVEMYGEIDVPELAKKLFYARQSELNNVDYSMTSEYVLYEILPGLIDPEAAESRKLFNEQAGKIFKEIWRK